MPSSEPLYLGGVDVVLSTRQKMSSSSGVFFANGSREGLLGVCKVLHNPSSSKELGNSKILSKLEGEWGAKVG